MLQECIGSSAARASLQSTHASAALMSLQQNVSSRCPSVLDMVT